MEPTYKNATQTVLSTATRRDLRGKLEKTCDMNDDMNESMDLGQEFDLDNPLTKEEKKRRNDDAMIFLRVKAEGDLIRKEEADARFKVFHDSLAKDVEKLSGDPIMEIRVPVSLSDAIDDQDPDYMYRTIYVPRSDHRVTPESIQRAIDFSIGLWNAPMDIRVPRKLSDAWDDSCEYDSVMVPRSDPRIPAPAPELVEIRVPRKLSDAWSDSCEYDSVMVPRSDPRIPAPAPEPLGVMRVPRKLSDAWADSCEYDLRTVPIPTPHIPAPAPVPEPLVEIRIPKSLNESVDSEDCDWLYNSILVPRSDSRVTPESIQRAIDFRKGLLE